MNLLGRRRWRGAPPQACLAEDGGEDASDMFVGGREEVADGDDGTGADWVYEFVFWVKIICCKKIRYVDDEAHRFSVPNHTERINHFCVTILFLVWCSKGHG